MHRLIIFILSLFCLEGVYSQDFQGKIRYFYYSQGYNDSVQNNYEESEWLMSFGKDKFKQEIINSESFLKGFVQLADVTNNKTYRYNLQYSKLPVNISKLDSCTSFKIYNEGKLTIAPMEKEAQKKILGYNSKRYKVVLDNFETDDLIFYCWATTDLIAAEPLRKNSLCITHSQPVLFPEIKGIILELLTINEKTKRVHLWRAMEIKQEELKESEFEIPTQLISDN